MEQSTRLLRWTYKYSRTRRTREILEKALTQRDRCSGATENLVGDASKALMRWIVA